MRNYSLKAKLSLLIISISSVLLIVGMFISYRETKSGLIKEAELAKEAILEETSMKLESIRDNKKSTIEAYFNTIIEQNLNFAKNPATVDAAKDFKKSFGAYLDDEAISSTKLKSMKDELKTFYTNDFDQKYKAENGKGAPIGSYFAKLNDTAVAL